MSDATQSRELRSLIDAAFEDAKSIRSRYPHQLLLALADQKVQEVLDSRFRAGQILKSVATPPAQLDTGLIPICFTFAPSSSVQLTGKSILVQLDHRCKVVAIDGDFVPERPNPIVDLRSSKSKLPLALATYNKSRKLSRRTNPAVTNQIRRLQADLLVRHGLLSSVEFSAIGGGDVISLSTDCVTYEETTEDTVIIVIVQDQNGNEIDRFEEIEADPGEPEATIIVDDAESTTVNDLLDRLGYPPI